jgi:GT2 family glycosyltransferase
VIEKYQFTVCSLGENPELFTCVDSLLQIKQLSKQDIELLVVINSSTFKNTFVPEVSVVFEPCRGYSNVRNKAIASTPSNSNVIFLDDDEIPTVQWFNALIEAHKRYPGEIITGPILPDGDSSVTTFRGQVATNYTSMLDGQMLKQAPTSNMLIPSTLIHHNLIYFDSIFNHSGSEDTDLCFRLRNRGVKIRFAKNALIKERQKEERFSQKYIDARRIRDIANYSLVIKRNSTFGRILYRYLTEISRAVIYSLLSVFSTAYAVERKAHVRSLTVLITGKPANP